MEENNTTALVRYIKAMDFGEKNLAVSADKRERGVPLNPDDLRILDIESKQKGMKDFITDIVSGSLKSKVNKKQTKSKRDEAIYLSISSLISEGHKLTSNSKTVGAAAIVADMFCVSEDLATKAYSNTKKFREKFNKEFLEELYGKSEGASSMI